MVRGCLDVTEATPLVTGRRAESNDRVRHTRAKTLRGLGFEVIHTPSLRNQSHVSVRLPQGANEWHDDEAARFESAFS